MSAVLELNSPADSAWERSVDEPLFEVVNGERLELPEMSADSSLIAKRLLVSLQQWLMRHPLGEATMETLFLLDGESNLRRRPDVAFVDFTRWPADQELPETGDWGVVPTLAVEVVSPHDLMHEVLHKVHEYLHYGVAEVWLIVPEEQVLYRYRSPQDLTIVTRDGQLSGEPVLPGFSLRMSDLLQRTLASAKSSATP